MSVAFDRDVIDQIFDDDNDDVKDKKEVEVPTESKKKRKKKRKRKDTELIGTAVQAEDTGVEVPSSVMVVDGTAGAAGWSTSGGSELAKKRFMSSKISQVIPPEVRWSKISP